MLRACFKHRKRVWDEGIPTEKKKQKKKPSHSNNDLLYQHVQDRRKKNHVMTLMYMYSPFPEGIFANSMQQSIQRHDFVMKYFGKYKFADTVRWYAAIDPQSGMYWLCIYFYNLYVFIIKNWSWILNS